MAGWQTHEADSPDSALEMAKHLRSKVDLMILDLHLHPAFTGAELQKRLKRILPEAKTLFVTGGMDEGFLADALHEGRCGFLAKPFSPTDLVNSAAHLFETMELQAR
jgi:DNA-binding NtrC family response regulator